MDVDNIKVEPIDEYDIDIEIEDEFRLQVKREMSIEIKNESSLNLDEFPLRFSDDEFKNIDNKLMKLNALDFQSSERLSSNLSKGSNSLTSQYLINQNEQEDKLKLMDLIKFHEDENLNFKVKSLKFGLEEMQCRLQPTDKSLLVPDKGFDQTCKSELNDIKDESQCSSIDNIDCLTKPVNFNNLIQQLPQAKVVLKRYKPNDSSQKTNLTDSPRQYKSCTSYCSLCKAPPRSSDISVCEKCGASIIYLCRSCDFSSNLHATVNRHYYDKHVLGPNRIIHCLYCDKNISTKKTLRDHYKNTHSIDGFTKKYQVTQFYTVSTSSNNEKYQCYKCDYRSSLRIAVKRHIRAKHDPRSKPINNDFMKHEMEKAKNLLELHCKDCNKLRSDDQFKCNDCNSLRLLYCCSRCQAEFSTWKFAMRHARTHLPKGNYVCAYCSKTFARIQTLGRHKRYCLVYNKKR